MGWLTETSVEIWRVTVAMAPYIILGLGAAVVVLALFPTDRIQRLLGRPGLSSNIKSALAGIPLPLCSCGVLPTALTLRRRGASNGATVSFLVSTPETGFDSIAVTYALINPLMAVLRPVAAFVSAVVTGSTVDRFGNAVAEKMPNGQGTSCLVCHQVDCDTAHPWTDRFTSAWRYVAFDFFPDIADWLVIGLVLSGILAVFLPANLFGAASVYGQIALAVIAGVPMYICASASTPIAAVLLAKGMSAGAVLVFLLVGPATNLASLTVLGRQLGRRTTALYLAGIIVTSIVIGLGVDKFLSHWDWTPNIEAAHNQDQTSIVQWFGVALLVLALLSTWIRRLRIKLARRQSSTPSTVNA